MISRTSTGTRSLLFVVRSVQKRGRVSCVCPNRNDDDSYDSTWELCIIILEIGRCMPVVSLQNRRFHVPVSIVFSYHLLQYMFLVQTLCGITAPAASIPVRQAQLKSRGKIDNDASRRPVRHSYGFLCCNTHLFRVPPFIHLQFFPIASNRAAWESQVELTPVVSSEPTVVISAGMI